MCWLTMLSVRLSEYRLLVVKFWGTQKLFRFSTVWGSVPLTPMLLKEQLYICFYFYLPRNRYILRIKTVLSEVQKQQPLPPNFDYKLRLLEYNTGLSCCIWCYWKDMPFRWVSGNSVQTVSPASPLETFPRVLAWVELQFASHYRICSEQSYWLK